MKVERLYRTKAGYFVDKESAMKTRRSDADYRSGSVWVEPVKEVDVLNIDGVYYELNRLEVKENV